MATSDTEPVPPVIALLYGEGPLTGVATIGQDRHGLAAAQILEASYARSAAERRRAG